jgi:tripartite-type tricarboxylate transporter receptor subunit TctC
MKRRVAGISERDVMKLPRRQFLHLASAAALALTFDPSQGQAQEWPARPVTMVVPTAAGGGADILGRILAGRLSEILGQPVIIENVGNAVAATNRIAKGMTDGYHFKSLRPVSGRRAEDFCEAQLHKVILEGL